MTAELKACALAGVAAGVLAVVAACAPGPGNTGAKMPAQAGTPPLPAEMARVTILRRGMMAGSTRVLTVFVNGTSTCDLYNGAYFEVDVPQGTTAITAQGGGAKFQTVTGRAEAGQRYYVDIGFESMGATHVAVIRRDHARGLLPALKRAQCPSGYYALRGTVSGQDSAIALLSDEDATPGAAARPASGATPGQDAASELAFWDAIKNSGDAADYRAYLETYPQGRFVALARVRAGLDQPPPAPLSAAPLPPPPLALPSGPERRVALVIGNGAYAHLGSLRNPVNDARAVTAALRRLDFDVATVENGSHRAMMRAIAEFGDRIGAGGVGLFYYAGHAVQVRGGNYLIPVDARIRAEAEVDYLAVNAGLALAQFDKAPARLGVTILDSCRDNPLPASFRSMNRGLAVVGTAPPGSLVVYATGPGQVAADGSGANSVFTEALLQHIERPGLKAQEMFNAVAVTVGERSSGQQVPWISATGIREDFFFKR